MKEKINALIRQQRFAEAAQLIKQGLQQNIDFREMRVLYAHILVLAQSWQEVNQLLPPRTNSLFTSGWLQSLLVNRPVNGGNQPIPWFTYPAIDFLDAVVRPHWRVFEWGSGHSTRWWAQRVKQVIAVESEPKWYQEINAPLAELSNVELVLREQEDAYVGMLAAQAETAFDVVVVDGKHRQRCLHSVLEHADRVRLLIVDNADRASLSPALQQCAEAGFLRLDFWGMVPSYLYKNCTSVLFKDPEFLRHQPPPATHHSSVGPSCEQAIHH